MAGWVWVYVHDPARDRACMVLVMELVWQWLGVIEFGLKRRLIWGAKT